jgi:hypothetical protein
LERKGYDRLFQGIKFCLTSFSFSHSQNHFLLILSDFLVLVFFIFILQIVMTKFRMFLAYDLFHSEHNKIKVEPALPRMKRRRM